MVDWKLDVRKSLRMPHREIEENMKEQLWYMKDRQVIYVSNRGFYSRGL